MRVIVLILLLPLLQAIVEGCTNEAHQCGSNLLRAQYSMCSRDGSREICTGSFRLSQLLGYTCGPCPVTQSCPTIDSVTTLETYTEGAPLQIEKSRPDTLCTLYMVINGEQRTPIARSYDGNDWESYSGDFAHVSFTCEENTCSGALPGLPNRRRFIRFILRNRVDTYTYEIAAFNRQAPAMTEDDVKARFLEQATFGQTKATIDSFPETAAEWIETQMALPATSHRQIFREHWNHRYEYPSYQGIVTTPCQEGTRYRKYAFTNKDRNKEVEIRTVSGRKVLSINGMIRTVVDVGNLYAGYVSDNIVYGDGFHQLCRDTNNAVGSTFRLLHDTRNICRDVYYDDGETERGLMLGVPPVFFDSTTQPSNPTINLDGHAIRVDEEYYENGSESLYLTDSLSDEVCTSTYPIVTGYPDYLVVGVFEGEYWIHDPRFIVEQNTVDNPRTNGGGDVVEATQGGPTDLYQTRCYSAPPTFMNDYGCVWSTDSDVCSPSYTASESIGLLYVNFLRAYENAERYIFAVTNLRQTDVNTTRPYNTPCTPGTTSRWIEVHQNDCTWRPVNHGQPATQTAFAPLFRNSYDDNPFVKDLSTPGGFSCAEEDEENVDFTILVDNVCWKNVHPSHLQVYDFTNWLSSYPDEQDQILQFANGTFAPFLFEFPEDSPMSVFYNRVGNGNIPELGRLGDTISLSDGSIFRNAFGSLMPREEISGSAVVCGSLNEVANVPENYGSAKRGAFDGLTAQFVSTTDADFIRQRYAIWYDVALNREDQLRQKVAWTLSQILVIAQNDLSLTTVTEAFTVYYDIFTRNAFGSYLQVLKEVAYSPLMGEMLSFVGSQSTFYIWNRSKRLEYADENFAREIMQLFSIGLLMLNKDGTNKLDGNGNPISTYTNKDIVEYARLWTGFRWQDKRGNIEDPATWGGNRIDPMKIDIGVRDFYPKMGLFRQYIGDGMPLCADLPRQHFLKAGATYRLLGSSSRPRLLSEPTDWGTKPEVKRMKLSEESGLYAKLCNKASPGDLSCRYESIVILEEDIDCNGQVECSINDPRVVEVEPGLYYEYTRVPCTHQAFNNAKLLRRPWRYYSCGDPRTEVGAVVCCPPGSNAGQEFLLYAGERTTHATAVARCEENGLEICTDPYWTCENCDYYNLGYWTSLSCTIKAKIDPSGNVGVVHALNGNVDRNRVEPAVREDTKTFFRVDWSGPIDMLLGDYEARCRDIGCDLDEFDNFCVCPINVQETQVFLGEPSRVGVLEKLKIGAFPPELLGIPNMQSTDLGNGVVVHSSNGEITIDSIFEVVDDYGVTRYRKNVQSVVRVGFGDDPLIFRNPPHITWFPFPDVRDAQYEVDAGLEQYFYHPNTAPFLAMRFAQRFGISNPSPRYIEIMSEAFTTGSYVDAATTKTFGSGRYGDLSALIAAMLLDREARSPVLDADPAYGSILEPLGKVVKVLRALEYEPDPDSPYLDLQDLQELIGQQPYSFPTVFSFFLPEFIPAGPAGEAGLYSPESIVLSGPKAIAMASGLISLVKYGLDDAYDGFGRGRGGRESDRQLGDYSYGRGRLTFQPESTSAAGIIDELATLLTAGRLHREKRSVMVEAYNAASTNSAALLDVEQLFFLTSEFHTNALSRNTGPIPPQAVETTPSGTEYRAVIYLFLGGGYDSFNLLVPDVCTGSNAKGVKVDEQYMTERGSLAFTPEERVLTIDVDRRSTSQPCSRFAIHDEMTIVKELYDDNDLLFIANMGVIDNGGITNENYLPLTRIRLFAHNSMSDETRAVDPKVRRLGTGVLGRMAHVLTNLGYKTNSIAIDNPSSAIVAEGGSTSPAPLIVSRRGVSPFDPKNEGETLDPKTMAFQLNAEGTTYSSFFGKTWSDQLTTGIQQAQQLDEALELTSNMDDYPTSGYLEQSFGMVSKLMQTKDARGTDRDFFYVNYGGWDHHSNMKENLRNRFIDLNGGLKALADELKFQGLWENTAVVVASEFARTITPNSGGGSDHAWGGHYMIMGGGIDGGRIIGKYPNDITPDGPLNLGRGRTIPTTSWDCLWNAVCNWLGVRQGEDLDYVLPNRNEVGGDGFSDLFGWRDVFTDRPPLLPPRA